MTAKSSIYRILILCMAILLFGLEIRAQDQEVMTSFHRLSMDSLQTIQNKTSSKDTLAVILFQKGARMIDNDGEASISILDSAISLAHEIGNTYYENKFRNRKVTALINTSQYQNAREELEEIEGFFLEYNNGESYGEWLIMQGFLNTETGNTNTALEYLTQAMEKAHEIKNYPMLHDIYNRVGIIYGTTGDLEKALEYYNRIIESCKQNNVRSLRTAAYNNAAYTYQTMGDTTIAVQYFQKVLEFRKKRNSKRSLAFAYGNMMQVEIMRGNFEKAISFADSSLQLFEDINLKPSILSKYQNLHTLYNKVDHQSKRKYYLERAKDSVEKWNISTAKSSVYEQYAEYLSEVDRHREAYQLLQKSVALKDSMQLATSKQTLESLEDKLKKEKEIIALENANIQNDLQRSEMKRQKLFSNFLILTSILLLGFICLLIYRAQERKKANKLLSEKNSIIALNLSEKEILLKEIHHRVKNNLQIVSSMLNMQTRHIKDPNVLNAVTESRNRVKSMAMIHQKLYQDDNLKGVAMNEYIETLISSLLHSYRGRANIQIHTEVEDLLLDVDSTIPIGLICNELITNCLKYAFPNGEEGNIWIHLNIVGKELHLEVKDDGVGIKDIQNLKSASSFGFTLIDSLAGKLKSDVEIISDNGTIIRFEFKNYKIVNK